MFYLKASKRRETYFVKRVDTSNERIRSQKEITSFALKGIYHMPYLDKAEHQERSFYID